LFEPPASAFATVAATMRSSIETASRSSVVKCGLRPACAVAPGLASRGAAPTGGRSPGSSGHGRPERTADYVKLGAGSRSDLEQWVNETFGSGKLTLCGTCLG